MSNTFDFLTPPKLDENEEHRIQYVGINRAMDRLFIVTPKLLEKDKKIIKENFDIQIIYL
ncbi:hypothetical protein KM914_06685 [Virgibacillus pantothenticus]|nr:hypothetical protein [Virgibacillus sp. 19R1-5]MBU8566127.1 hypothetical protein [Virgibacillus pantothenticus]MBU8600577.1 hypothetical protein [Virgibacillus pantothenticus]MBU8634447.1 hypothetical protein [Virgibacillus pantothenticus]MBU8642716.1 hypothetical protein [Virgibacillus pantothenticus]